MKNVRLAIWSLTLLGLALAGCVAEESIRITNGQGEMAGEVTANSVILQSRLTAVSGLVDGDVPGAPGVARFQIDTSEGFTDPVQTRWLEASAENDFIVKVRVTGLEAGTQYVYRLVYGPRQDLTRTGPNRRFRTLPGPDAREEVSFVVVTGMNYWAFHDHPRLAYKGPDKSLGYPALKTILDMKPAFFVGTGDNVYYDLPFEGSARTASAMRRKWHEQFVQPRYIEMFAEVPTYWEKDDHDYRYNDCDNTSDAEPSVELGAAIFSRAGSHRRPRGPGRPHLPDAPGFQRPADLAARRAGLSQSSHDAGRPRKEPVGKAPAGVDAKNSARKRRGLQDSDFSHSHDRSG